MADNERDKAGAALKSVSEKLRAHTLTENELVESGYGRLAIAKVIGVTSEELYELALRGFTVLQAGYFPEAEFLFDLLVFLDGRQSYFRNALGVAFLAQDRLKEAEGCFRLAVSMHSKEPSYHVNLGEVLLKQEKFVEAFEEFEEADRLDPEKKDLFVNRARLLVEGVKAQGGVQTLTKRYEEFRAAQLKLAEEQGSQKPSKGDEPPGRPGKRRGASKARTAKK
jgi:Tfp pilus assembly protein PilF